MVLSVPGVLISRDGAIREYVGHSNRNGTLFGTWERIDRRRWFSVCVACRERFGGGSQSDVARILHDHWKSSPSSTHMWVRSGWS